MAAKTAVRIQAGFTLIEVITVVVILSIVAVIGSNFIVETVESYDRAQQRSKLIHRGRQAVERISRQLRSALPHSLRSSNDGSGLCIEFMPVVGGGNYLGPDYDNDGAADSEELPTVDNGAIPAAAYAVITAPFDLNLGAAQYLSVGIMAATELGNLTTIGAIGAAGITSVPLGGAQIFNRNSINKRFFILDNPSRFCITGTQLFYYDNYGLINIGVAGIANGQPGGASASLLSDHIGDLTGITPFLVSTSTEDRNTVVHMTIPFSSRDGKETVELKQSVMVRNVP